MTRHGAPAAEAVAAAGPRGLLDLFTTFTRLSLSGFGGVLPWVHRVLVDDKRWLTREEMVELVALGQVLPGPNICNVSLMIGDRYFGWRGACVALAGMLLPPAALLLVIATVLFGSTEYEPVRRAMSGMAAVAAGLIIATGLKMAPALRGRYEWLGFGAAAFVAVGWLRLPLVPVLFGLGTVALALAWWSDGR